MSLCPLSGGQTPTSLDVKFWLKQLKGWLQGLDAEQNC